jgi:nucleoside-diphosphate-sugar epimerase
MKVLLLGATGNLGSRLVPALLTHGHTVIALVRSSNKLESLLPASVFQQITVVEGDATSQSLVKSAILDNNCDAVVSAAGVAAMAPWGKSDLPVIFKSILEAVQQAGVERKSPLRTWFMGGMSVLYYPGTESMLSNQYVHPTTACNISD